MWPAGNRHARSRHTWRGKGGGDPLGWLSRLVACVNWCCKILQHCALCAFTTGAGSVLFLSEAAKLSVATCVVLPPQHAQHRIISAPVAAPRVPITSFFSIGLIQRPPSSSKTASGAFCPRALSTAPLSRRSTDPAHLGVGPGRLSGCRSAPGGSGRGGGAAACPCAPACWRQPCACRLPCARLGQQLSPQGGGCVSWGGEGRLKRSGGRAKKQ